MSQVFIKQIEQTVSNSNNKQIFKSGNNNMHVSNRSGIYCRQHPTQQYANYCTSLNCLKPLCPDCVQIHIKLHDKQQIQSWRNCLFKQRNSVSSTLITLKKIEQEQRKYMSHKSVDQVIEQNVKTIQMVKQKVHRVVEQVFSNYEQHVTSLIRKNYRVDLPDLKKLRLAIQQLVKLSQKLDGAGINILQGLKKSLQLDHQSLLKFFQEFSYKQHKPVNQTFFIQNHELYPKLKSNLEGSLFSSKNNHSSSPQKHQSMTPKNRQNQQFQSENAGLFQPLKITLSNYFTEKSPFKLLHFFIPQSNQLKILPIQSAHNLDSKWQSYLFEGKHTLPCYFKSIITPNGDIYLTGGSKDQKRSKDIHAYNHEKNSLDPVCKMKYERSSHSICYSGGLIYLIGGFSSTQGNVTRTCQVYNPQQRTCKQISPLNAPSANSCAVSFNDEFIFKLGGVQNKTKGNNLIQMYSIKKNKWIVVDVQPDKRIPQLQLLSFTAAVQINQNQLLVFGGYDNSEIEKPERLCYTLQVNTNKGSVRVKNYNTTPLPYAQGFWNNNPVVYNHKVYALQNINDPQDQLTAIADQKRVIIFDGDRWHS